MKTKPSDIVDWLLSCIGRDEADGYQQSEGSEATWYVNGPLEAYDAQGGQFSVRDSQGNDFVVTVKARTRPTSDVEIHRAEDRNERAREDKHGRIRVSSSPVVVWLAVQGGNTIALFDRLKDARRAFPGARVVRD